MSRESDSVSPRRLAAAEGGREEEEMAEAAGTGAGGLDGHLEGMIEHVMGQIRETFASANGNATQSFESPYDFAMGFIHAVDWRERWIQGLIAAEASLLAVAVLTRKWQTVQCVIFVLTS